MFTTVYYTLDWWQCIVPSLCIGSVAILLRSIQGSWLAPGAAWGGFWFFATFLPLLLAPEYPVSLSALWAILAFVVCIGAGSQVALLCLGRRVLAPRENDKFLAPYVVVALMIASAFAALIVIRDLLFISDSSLGSFGNFADLHTTAQDLSNARYSGVIEPVRTRLLLSFLYCACIIGGHSFATQVSFKLRALTLVPVFSTLCIAAVSSAKAGFLFCMILWTSAFLAASVGNSTHPLKLKAASVLKVTAFGAATLLLFVVLLAIRYGTDDSVNLAFIVGRLKLYLLGHLSVFSGWWDYVAENGFELQWGRRLLFGPAAQLGLADRVMGAYDVIIYKQYDLDSNVFSVYRAVIEDFSLFGALSFSVIFGFTGGIAYRTISGGSAFGRTTLVAFYAVLLTSHVNNIFGYTTTLASLIGFLVTLGLCKIGGLHRLSGDRISQSTASSASRIKPDAS